MCEHIVSIVNIIVKLCVNIIAVLTLLCEHWNTSPVSEYFNFILHFISCVTRDGKTLLLTG